MVGAYKDVLSDPATLPSSDPLEPTEPSTLLPIVQIQATRQSIDSMFAIRGQQQSKKKANARQKAKELQQQKTSRQTIGSGSFWRPRSLTPPLIQMELIRPGKHRVKVITNVVENRPSKKMRII